MPGFHETHAHILSLVKEGKLKEAIEEFSLSVGNNQLKNAAIALQSQHSVLQMQVTKGVLFVDQQSVLTNRIAASMVELLDLWVNVENGESIYLLSNHLSLVDLDIVGGNFLGNIDARNPHFSGRGHELKRLKEQLQSGKTSILTAVHGLGGIGKTALAIEYAHVFAGDYGGGRWVVRCEGKEDLLTSIAELSAALAIEFTEYEKKDTRLQFDRVMAELRQLANKHSSPCCLLILDNVDQPSLLAPVQAKLLSSDGWLHVIATTRLGEDSLHGPQKDRTFLPVDELPDGDALELITSYQPGGQFKDKSDQEAAKGIISLLGGFALAVETTANYLGHYHEEVDCKGFLERLKEEGLEGINTVTTQTDEGTRHGKKRLTATLAPTLERLSKLELLILNYASLLPLDSVPLPWVRALVEKEYPGIAGEAKPGYPDPWKKLFRPLLGLRLLQRVHIPGKDGKVLLVKMHRLVGELLQKRMEGSLPGYLDKLAGHAILRSAYLKDNWYKPKDRWETGPLLGFGEMLVNHLGVGLTLGSEDDKFNIASLIANIADIASLQFWNLDAKRLHLKVIEIREKALPEEHPYLAHSYSYLAIVERRLGNLGEARRLSYKAIRIREKVLPEGHPDLAQSYNNLAIVERRLGNLGEARRLSYKAIKIREKGLPEGHLDLAQSYDNMASIEQRLGNLDEARSLHLKAIETWKKTLVEGHPNFATSYNNLGTVEYALGNLGKARRLHLKAIRIREKALPREHPKIAQSYNNLASVEQRLGNLDEAKRLHFKAINIREKALPEGHPELASSYNNLSFVEKAQGNLPEARRLILMAIEIEERVWPDGHPNLAISYNNLAFIEQALGNLGKAKQLHLKAIGIREKVWPDGHPYLAASYNNLALVEENLGNPEEAKRLRKMAEEISTSQNP